MNWLKDMRQAEGAIVAGHMEEIVTTAKTVVESAEWAAKDPLSRVGW